MIYLDNGATTFPKPRQMNYAMQQCMEKYCGNPGRSGHAMAMKTAQGIYRTRQLLGKLFNIEDYSRIVFTLNTTESLNLGIKGVLKRGDHVITTSMEHNSVLRPIKALEREGISNSIIKCKKDGSISAEAFISHIKENTKLIICTHASNVTGTIMPIERIGRMVREKGILFMVDAAQSAGVLPIDVEEMCIDLLAFPGHKSLLGPLGTGGLYVREGISIKPLKEGGTGTASKDLRQPVEFPESMESGTVNAPGIIGLGKSIEFINEVGIENIRKHEEKLIYKFHSGLMNMGTNVSVYGPEDVSLKTGVVLFNIQGISCEEVTEILSSKYGIATRGGFHCAGLAHETIGTGNTGAVRLSVGPFNTEREIEYALKAINEICRNH